MTSPEGDGTPIPIVRPSPSPLFKLHIYIGRGVMSRHRIHTLDREKVLLIIDRTLSYRDLDHIYLERVRE